MENVDNIAVCVCVHRGGNEEKEIVILYSRRLIGDVGYIHVKPKFIKCAWQNTTMTD